MNYTLSDAYATDAGTGHRLHQDDQPVPTVVSAKDMNSIIWSLMKVIETAGITAATFDPTNVNTYNRLLLAIQALTGVAVLSSSGQPYGFTVGTLQVLWGKVATSNVTVTLPVAFADANYTLIVGNADTQGSYNDVAYGTVTDSGHIFVATKASATGATSNFAVNWIALGKKAP